MSEWQIEPGTGKRYRMNGFIKEYEPQIMTTCGTLPESKASQILDANKEKSKERLEVERKTTMRTMVCPYKTMRNSYSAFCSGDRCVFFETDNCSFKKESAPRASQGKYCPYMGGNCKDICAMYEDGCKIKNI